MARIVLAGYMARHPLGGMLSGWIQWLVGFQRLGHDVYFIEKCDGPNACFDPERNVMGDDCSYGIAVLDSLLDRFGLRDRWCFIDVSGQAYGLSWAQLAPVLRSADVFVDYGAHGSWEEETNNIPIRVLIDGEPGYRQMRMEQDLAQGWRLPTFDYYFTFGMNLGTGACSAPTAGRPWRSMFHPVVVDLFPERAADPTTPFTTVMNWQSHRPIEFRGQVYGQKDMEFEKFIDLPTRVEAQLELAVAGKTVPTARLQSHGWSVIAAQQVTMTVDSYVDYIAGSRGEFSVCKHVFVATKSGWFSERSAAFLASGRPVVAQDTGFGDHLPCGRGLFAVSEVSEAAAAIEEISGSYQQHSRWARELAREHLDARRTLRSFLAELGV